MSQTFSVSVENEEDNHVSLHAFHCWGQETPRSSTKFSYFVLLLLCWGSRPGPHTGICSTSEQCISSLVFKKCIFCNNVKPIKNASFGGVDKWETVWAGEIAHKQTFKKLQDNTNGLESSKLTLKISLTVQDLNFIINFSVCAWQTWHIQCTCLFFLGHLGKSFMHYVLLPH